jgi:hypothetical protein
MRIFLAPILKYYFISSNAKKLSFCKKNLDCANIGGGTIFPRSLKTTRKKNNFKLCQIFSVFKSLTNPLYLLNIVFPKFDPLTAIGMAFFVDLGPK